MFYKGHAAQHSFMMFSVSAAFPSGQASAPMMCISSISWKICSACRASGAGQGVLQERGTNPVFTPEKILEFMG